MNARLWLDLLLAAAAIHFALKYLRYRAKVKQSGILGPWPIRTQPLDAFDPVFRTDEFGPTTAALVTFLGRGALNVPGGVSDTESWVLSALAKQAHRIFEFGTCTGKTTMHFALNAPDDAHITTLTLAPEQVEAYARTSGDDAGLSRVAVRESAFTRFIYSPLDAARKITQLFADSKQFDEAPYRAQMDLVFVDGSHALSYVLSDSAKALAMVAPGGIVLWHDYRGPYDTKDVYRGLNQLARSHPLVHLEGTSLVAYRAPAA